MEISIQIEGVTPILINRFTDEAALKATDGTTGTTVGDAGTPQEIAAAALYVDDDGKPIMPQPNILSCLTAAGKFHKVGRVKVTTQRSSLVPAAVEIREMYFPLEHEETWSVDTRPVRIPATGGRILRHRPCFHDWKLSFVVHLNTTIFSAKLFRAIVDDAGKKIGLGDFRPDCKGPFGRFVVTHWKNGEKK